MSSLTIQKKKIKMNSNNTIKKWNITKYITFKFKYKMIYYSLKYNDNGKIMI